MQTNCQYCNELVLKKNIARHYKTKACLEKRGIQQTQEQRNEKLVTCGYCGVNVQNLTVHQQSLTCQQKQGKQLSDIYEKCEYCSENVLPIDKARHQQSYKCRLYQPQDSDCQFGVCLVCKLDHQVLIDVCQDCEVKSCKLCAQPLEECPICQEQVSFELSFDDLLELCVDRIDKIKAVFGKLLYKLGFTERQVNKMIVELTSQEASIGGIKQDIKNAMKVAILELFIIGTYKEADIFFEELLNEYVIMIFDDGEKYRVLQGVLVPRSDQQQPIKYGDAVKKLPAPYKMF